MSLLGRATLFLFCGALLYGRPASADIEMPPIGTIDFYGLRSLSESAVRQQLPFKEGDALPETPPPSREKIARALGVARVEFAIVCCTSEGRTQIYVGVQERAASEIRYNRSPTGDVRLPAEILTANDRYLDAIYEAVRTGQAAEDDSHGHALFAYAPARAQEEVFLAFAKDHRPLLVDVLQHSSEAHQRAVAAQLLAYDPDKKAIVKSLSRAASDPDGSVRNNAVRALAVIASYSMTHPELRIRIDAAPFVQMINSIVWTDRNKGLFILNSLTAARDARLLKSLRQEARASLVEMCAWKGGGHASPACQILRRVMGMPDDGDPQSRQTTLDRARSMHLGIPAIQ
jgi:hypothetical protein